MENRVLAIIAGFIAMAFIAIAYFVKNKSLSKTEVKQFIKHIKTSSGELK